MLATRDASGWRLVAAAVGVVTTAVLAQPAPESDPPRHHRECDCQRRSPLPTRAILHTTKGTITCALHAHEAPNTVANFARGSRAATSTTV